MGLGKMQREFTETKTETETEREPESQRPIDKIMNHFRKDSEPQPITPYTMMERVCSIEEKADLAMKKLDGIERSVIDMTNVLEKFRKLVDELEEDGK